MHNDGSKIAMGGHVERATIYCKNVEQSVQICKSSGKPRFEPSEIDRLARTVRVSWGAPIISPLLRCIIPGHRPS